MKKELVRTLEGLVKRLGVQDVPTIELEVPPADAFGDLSTPVAMIISKTLKKSPRKIAEELVRLFEDRSAFERIEIAGPGFINFTFSKQYLYSRIRELLRDSRAFLRSDIGGGRRVQIEFVSANPTGPLHLGHGRGGAIGEALANLLHAAGFQVEREYYVNDAGKQVRLLGLSVFARYQHLLGMEYPFPPDGYKGDYIEVIADKIVREKGKAFAQKKFEEVGDFFIDYTYKHILAEITRDLGEFGIHFDTWQSERELFRSGEVNQTIEDLRTRGHIYEQDGAVWFRATSFGDDKDRVIIKQDGEYTYFTSDIAYHRKKIERGFDEIIDIWGADHHGYIPRIQAVIEALDCPKEKLKVVLVQMVSLLRGGKPVQMSKRAGEFVTLREVIEEVGADTTKFIFLTRRPDSHLEFDLETAKAQSAENPVFYVQYAHARIQSIFARAKEQGIDAEALEGADFSMLCEPEELKIIKKLLVFPMMFENAVYAREPHRVTFYLQELAGIFHPYYNKHRVITEDIELTMARLALCEAVRVILNDGLAILGVSIPEKM